MKYVEEIQRAMKMLSEDPRTVVIGQSVKWKGTGLFWTLENTWDDKRRIELPVLEDFQTGVSIGMALEGFIPVSIYPRWDFVLLAANQITNHLDRLKFMSDGQYDPFVIIRTAVGSVKPLFPGEQHTGDYGEAFKKMLKYVKVYELKKAEDIVPTYKKAMEERIPCIIVEYPDLYETS